MITSDEIPLLAIDNLHVVFTVAGRLLPAVRGVSLRLAPGEALGIVGESGSGKSVTARSVLGLLPAQAVAVSGSIRLAGQEIVGLDEKGFREIRRRTASMIFQDPMRSLNPTMSVWSQLRESLRVSGPGMSARAMGRRARELMDLVQMPAPEERLRAYPHQLSGGMRQRVCIAMALASEPSLLIADEPTTALDVTVQAQILDLLDTLRRDLNMALMLITHDLAVAAERTDLIAVMYGGQVVEAARTEALISSIRVPYTQALFDSSPVPSTPRRSVLPAIPGRPPALADVPAGCAFAERCFHRKTLLPAQQERCRAEEPHPTDVGGSVVRCWFPLDDQHQRDIPQGGEG